MCFFFFFKQKTAYEMRISDWSSDVCSSDLVLPVKAAVLYSDGLSLREYDASVGKTFHNRASEDGTLYDAEKGENSNKLFDRHFIVPGTLLVQVISTHGRLLPQEGLDHLLLSIGEAGSYGGQTSVSGVNVRTHIAGIYASRVERAETSPFHLAAAIIADGGCCDVGMAIARIHEMVAPSHESGDRKSTRLNSSHYCTSRMPSSA